MFNEGTTHNRKELNKVEINDHKDSQWNYMENIMHTLRVSKKVENIKNQTELKNKISEINNKLERVR